MDLTSGAFLGLHLVDAHAGHSVLLRAGLVPDAVCRLGAEIPGFRPLRAHA